MENAIRDRFAFSYESGVTGSFLVASTSKDEKIIEFQVNMLAKNPNKHILPFDIIRNNDRINIYYNITSKLSLSQYLKRSQLSKNEFLDIFSGIVKTLLNSKGYLLSDNSFILDEEYIYINPDTKCISMVYLPIRLDIDITKALKNFAINFVVYSANIYEEDSDGFLQQFLNFLKKDTFSIIEFDKFLKEMKRLARKQEKESNEFNEVQKKEQTAENVEVQQKKEEDLKENRFKIEIPKPKAVEGRETKKDVSSNYGQSKSEFRKNDGGKEEKNIVSSFSGNPNVIVGAVIQTVIAIIVLFLFFSGKLDSTGNDKISTAIGLLLVGAAVSYFMWKNILKIKFSDKKNLQSKAGDNNGRENTGRNSVPKVIEKIPKPAKKQNEQSIPNTRRAIANENKMNESKISENSVSIPIKISGNVNETILLDSSDVKHARLQVIKDDGIEEIIINKPSFIIGRLEGQVDYVHTNNAIGKVHAEIITRDECYYLKDLNSKNGTYINGKRIDSNKEYEIKNNDRITLANSEFIFIVM
ncbi:DUF6382 domain-containing protein [Acetivibrio clariflavus]|uniref:DUF6382 domain-containing protein n=1 Tax=Acetivibrio clariflavus TaxID=288965 RepID=UPI000480A740|nr:DUF6382 domain-containing protein [Acetivibrio clariflavus]